MIINYLDWDSDFFGIGVASATVDPVDNECDVIAGIVSYEKKCDLVYIHTPKSYLFSEKILSDKKILLVDSKVVYEGNVDKQVALDMDNHISLYLEKKVHPDLLALALQSGAYSRYKSDKNFNCNAYERLYTQWIENSVNGSIADAILVYKNEEKIEGMVTIRLDQQKGSGTIGLIAVDGSVHNKGIGSLLINAVKNYSVQHSIYHIEVATQLENKRACVFYEKCCLSVKSITNTYHFWL